MKLSLTDGFPEPLRTYAKQHELAYRMLSHMLQSEGVENEAQSFLPAIEKTDKGKPFLRDYPEVFFNISHSSSCVAVVLSDRLVGIDVQDRFLWKDSLADCILHPVEQEKLMRCRDAREREEQLNRIWCRKESYVKCIGTGLTKDLKTINTMYKGRYLETAEGRFGFTEFQNPDYTLCICEGVME